MLAGLGAAIARICRLPRVDSHILRLLLEEAYIFLRLCVAVHPLDDAAESLGARVLEALRHISIVPYAQLFERTHLEALRCLATTLVQARLRGRSSLRRCLLRRLRRLASGVGVEQWGRLGGVLTGVSATAVLEARGVRFHFIYISPNLFS